MNLRPCPTALRGVKGAGHLWPLDAGHLFILDFQSVLGFFMQYV